MPTAMARTRALSSSCSAARLALTGLCLLLVPGRGSAGKPDTGSSSTQAGSSAWSGTLSGGGFMTLGNTQSIRITARANLARKLINPWSSAQLNAQASYGESMEERFLERIRIEPELELFLDERDYVRLGGYWKRDYFAGISRAFAALVVPGRRLVTTEYVDLDWEVGVLWETRVSTDGETRRTAKVLGGGAIRWDPSRYLRFSASWETTRDLREWRDWDFSGIMGSENFLSEKVSVFLGYEVQYYNIPPSKLGESIDMSITLELRISL
ncbi:DUF481 domain-containing protein [Candidatus Fermentibacterales bacterium]|nr:DUF481 domain-containing protein [Candidatus Fermentibacterales bacterium]